MNNFASKTLVAVMAASFLPSAIYATDMEFDIEDAISNAARTFGEPVASFERERGVPMMHDDVTDRKYELRVGCRSTFERYHSFLFLT